VNPIAEPPWTVREDRNTIQQRISGPIGRKKAQAAEDFLKFLPTIPSSDIQVFSDGSKSEGSDGATGAGSVTYQYSLQVDRQTRSLGLNAEVFDAEAIAALHGARTALNLPSARFATDLWVFLDNLEVATRLLSHSTGTSQSVFEEFREIARKWPERARLPHTRPGSVRIRWVPGHLKISGNEEADKAAKEGTLLPDPADSICTLASLKRIARTKASKATRRLWPLVAPDSYIDLTVPYGLGSSVLSIRRPEAGRILAIRSGHGDFADYHTRFHHNDALLYCSCGKRKSPLHFYFCRKGKATKSLPGPPSDNLQWLLCTSTGINKLAKWFTDTRFYQEICPGHTRGPAVINSVP
jgi:ribonuclease HI